MNHSIVNTAILLFARTAEYDAQHKNFLEGQSFSKNISVSHKMFLDTHSKCVQAGLPVFHLSEMEQKGSNFADRLKNSFEDVFKQGYDNIIAVGNDCPQLSVSDINNAASNLEQGKAVLGKTNQGGLYLMGLSRNAFYQLDITQIAWNTNQVFGEIWEKLNVFTRTYLLKQKSEINSESDIHLFSSYLNNELHNWLIGQSANKAFNLNHFFSTVVYEFSENEVNRGPPLRN